MRLLCNFCQTVLALLDFSKENSGEKTLTNGNTKKHCFHYGLIKPRLSLRIDLCGSREAFESFAVFFSCVCWLILFVCLCECHVVLLGDYIIVSTQRLHLRLHCCRSKPPLTHFCDDNTLPKWSLLSSIRGFTLWNTHSWEHVGVCMCRHAVHRCAKIYSQSNTQRKIQPWYYFVMKSSGVLHRGGCGWGSNHCLALWNVISSNRISCSLWL